jgi:cytoskeletal protein CcmA (bactofilin family)
MESTSESSPSPRKATGAKNPEKKAPTTRRRKKGELVAFFGKGVDVKGKIKNHGNMRVDGNFEGEIITKGSLLVGDHGVIQAKIKAGTVVSEGKITGDIVAKEKVRLLGEAIMDGSVITPQLLTEEGVTLNMPWTVWMKQGKFSQKILDARAIQVVDGNGVDQQELISKP